MLINKNIKLLVVHCSDTEDSKNLSALDLHKMHLNFGWDGIGYHKVICRSGKIENGRPEYWIGAHVRGKNEISLGVCLIGRTNFTRKQYIEKFKTLTDGIITQKESQRFLKLVQNLKKLKASSLAGLNPNVIPRFKGKKTYKLSIF